MFIEVVLVDMTLNESIMSRLLCLPINLFTGRLYGRYRDRVIRKLRSVSASRIIPMLGDILAYISFQLPLYVLVLLSIGLSMSAIATATLSQTLALFVLGAPYGMWLTQTRRWIKPQSVVEQ